jgi:Mrp family chromosome partitioning ATPase
MAKISEALDRAGVGLGQATGRAMAKAPEPTAFRPAHSPAIIKLFYTVEALKPQNAHVVLQFLAATAGEGTTTIAKGYAAVAASEGNQNVLFIDCDPASRSDEQNGGATPTLIEAHKQGLAIEEVARQSKLYGNLRLIQLSRSPNPLIEIDSEDLVLLFARLREHFSTIILDCVAANRGPDSIAISRYCDGTILIVRAEAVRSAVVKTVEENIKLVGGQIIGAVFNRRQQYIPRWLYSSLFSSSV